MFDARASMPAGRDCGCVHMHCSGLRCFLPSLALRSVYFFFHMFFLLTYSNALEEDDFRSGRR